MGFFIASLLILFIVAAILHVDFFFAIVYLFCGSYILSRLWARHTVGHLQVERSFADHAFLGDQVVVDLAVRNTSWLPIPWLEIHESLPVQLTTPPFHREVIGLGPRRQSRLRYTLHCQQRGYYPVGPLVLETGDLLGFDLHSQVRVAPKSIIIYPEVVPLQQLGLPTRSPLIALDTPFHLFEDPARIMGVRDYQSGDCPRRIHWTATASAGHLLVKQYQPSTARETLIFLDLSKDDYGQRQHYTATELAITSAASIANHIITKEKLPVGLATEAWDPLTGERVQFYLPPRSERAHLMSLLEILARVQVTEHAAFADLLHRRSTRLPWGATLVIITGNEREALLDTLITLRHASFAIALILVQPARPSEHLQKRADLLGIPVHRIWHHRDLEAWS